MSQRMYWKETEVEIANINRSNFQFRLERCETNTAALTQRLRCVSCFINKQNESLEFLSSYFRCLAGSANKDRLRKFNSKDFTSDEREIESEIFNYSDYKVDRNAFNQSELQMDIYGN